MTRSSTFSRLALAAAIGLVASASQAETVNQPLRLVYGVGANFGGGTLATVTFTDGSTQNVKAGQGLHFFVGGEYRFTRQVTAQATLGYQYATTQQATNGSLKFTRVPVEVLGHYALTDNWRVGGGLRFVRSPELKGSGVLDGSVKFGSTTGVVLEGEYLFNPAFGLKLRTTHESYKAQGATDSVSGNNLGLYVVGYY